MTMTTLRWSASPAPMAGAPETTTPAPAAWRMAIARLLRDASRALDVQAERLTATRQTPPEPDVDREFYAQAGAPEGALFVDGRLVGHLPGLERL